MTGKSIARRPAAAIVSKTVIYILLAFWAVTTIYPFIWVGANSFKVKRFIRTESFAIPTGEMFTTEHYQSAFDRIPILSAYRNSLVISGAVTVFVIVIAGLCAYGLARYNFKGRKLLHSLVLAAMMFPAFATIIPVYRMEFKWGIANTHSLPLTWLSIILPQIAGNISFAVIVLMGYIRSLPIDLEEAAYLEGYGVARIFFRIIIPLARPSFATVGIFTFLWSYNDLFTQLFFLRYEKFYSITRLLNMISSQEGTNYGLLCSAVVLVVVPVLLVYILLQKNIVKGLTAGAVKG